MIDPRIPLALGDEVDQLRAEINEQARLLGISAENELALRAENERLNAELTEAKKDAERLDYVQEHGVTIAIVPLTTGGLLGFEIGGILKSKRFYLREAIDAAMKGK